MAGSRTDKAKAHAKSSKKWYYSKHKENKEKARIRMAAARAKSLIDSTPAVASMPAMPDETTKPQKKSGFLPKWLSCSHLESCSKFSLSIDGEDVEPTRKFDGWIYEGFDEMDIEEYLLEGPGSEDLSD